jgi:hypothetical protein
MNIHKPIIRKQSSKVGLFCNARDEKNIKEWAAHHLLIGFDIIIIFDHKSIYPLTNIFNNFDKRVKIIRVNFETDNIKLVFMDRAKKIATILKMDWFIYLDADEFLILNDRFRGVKHFLNSYPYADSIGVNWLMFGSNHFIQDPSGQLIENYIRSEQFLNKHVKSFVRPSEIINCINPHFYNIKKPFKMVGIDSKIMKEPYCFNDINISFDKAAAYVAHYVYQSEESYKKRKIRRADDGLIRKDIGKEIHKCFNDIINTQPQKYLKNIKEFLKYYNA